MKYILFHPTKNNKVGGAQGVVVNLAEELASQGKNVAVIDHACGFVSTNIKNKKIQLLIIEKQINEVSADLAQDDVLICFNRYIRKLLINGNKINCKIIFWDVYYPFWRTLLGFSKFDIPFFTNFYRAKLLSFLTAHNALLAMELRGEEYISKFSITKPEILPIPCKKIWNYKNSLEYNKNHYCYIGRFEDWKAYPVIQILGDISLLPEGGQLDIYTDDSEGFSRFLNEKMIIPNNVHIEYIVGKYGANLHNELATYQIVFAMGTACLEAAQCGSPVILMDFSSSLIVSYHYRFLYQNDELGTLGRNIQDVSYGENNFSTVVDESLNKRSDIVKLNEKYIEDNHSISTIAKRLVLLANKSQLTCSTYIAFSKKIPFFYFYLLIRDKLVC